MHDAAIFRAAWAAIENTVVATLTGSTIAGAVTADGGTGLAIRRAGAGILKPRAANPVCAETVRVAGCRIFRKHVADPVATNAIERAIRRATELVLGGAARPVTTMTAWRGKANAVDAIQADAVFI